MNSRDSMGMERVINLMSSPAVRTAVRCVLACAATAVLSAASQSDD